jgi:hypothetical protein
MENGLLNSFIWLSLNFRRALVHDQFLSFASVASIIDAGRYPVVSRWVRVSEIVLPIRLPMRRQKSVMDLRCAFGKPKLSPG